MSKLQTLTDKTAISLSLACSIHCLLLPLSVVLVPTLTALPLANEAFHRYLLLAVLPTSIYALTMGCKKHKRYRVALLGSIGLLLLILAAVAGHDLLGEQWEKAATVLGSSFIALTHLWNHHLCQQSQNDCGCVEPAKAAL